MKPEVRKSLLLNSCKSIVDLAKIWPKPTDTKITLSDRGLNPSMCDQAKLLHRDIDSLSRFIKTIHDSLSDDDMFNAFSEDETEELANLFQDAEKKLDREVEILKTRGENSIKDRNLRYESLSGEVKQTEILIRNIIRNRLLQNQISSLWEEIAGPNKSSEEDRFPSDETIKNKLDKTFKRIQELEDFVRERMEKAANLLSHEAAYEAIDKVIKRHSFYSKMWAIAMAMSLIIAGRLIIWMSVEDDMLFFWKGPVFRHIILFSDGVSAASIAINKFLLASFAFGICLISSRMYQTHIHNIVTNDHRRIAILCFSRLYSAIESHDVESRHNLTVQAAEALFKQGATGFIPKGSNEFLVPAAILSKIGKEKA